MPQKDYAGNDRSRRGRRSSTLRARRGNLQRGPSRIRDLGQHKELISYARLRLRTTLSPPNAAMATDNSASDAGSGTCSGPASDCTWTVRLLGKAKPEAVAEATNSAVTSWLKPVS